MYHLLGQEIGSPYSKAISEHAAAHLSMYYVCMCMSVSPSVGITLESLGHCIHLFIQQIFVCPLCVSCSARQQKIKDEQHMACVPKEEREKISKYILSEQCLTESRWIFTHFPGVESKRTLQAEGNSIWRPEKRQEI